VKPEVHPNADRLNVVHHRRFTVVVGKDDFKENDLAAYIEPDMMVPPALLGLPSEAKPQRIKAKKLRGVWSMGLLVPAPEGSRVGDDVMEKLGVVRYEPPFMGESVATGATAHKAPPGLDVKYDVENWYKYGDALADGEIVVVTEKIHGTNARFTVRDGELYVGSRSRWLDDGDNVYWRTVSKYPGIKAMLTEFPGFTLYGEIYGWVQDLRYDHLPGQFSFAAFDILGEDGRWVDFPLFEQTMNDYQIPMVPVLVRPVQYSDRLAEYADGKSVIASHLREGCVIRPVKERWDRTVGRSHLKIVSNKYLERA